MKKERKSSIVALAICALLIIVAVAGSYAYYVAQIDNGTSTPVSVTSKTLGMHFADGKDITLDNVLPGQKFVKTFKISNTGTKTMKYNISFIDVYNELTNKDELVYTLEKDGTAIATNVTFPSADTAIASDIEINPNDEFTYTLTIEYLNTNSSQNIDMGKTIKATINITDVVEVVQP